jgi:hypothetical protein
LWESCGGSDVDLLIILPFDGQGFWQWLEILDRTNAPSVLDLRIYRPDDAVALSG